jgi:hypothetical protein
MIRDLLSEITSTTDLILQKKLLDQHILTDSNSIAILESVHPIETYSCAVFALGFVKDEYYESIACGQNEAYASPEFISFLIAKGYIKLIKDKTLYDKSLIVYKDKERVRHVGINVSKGRVRSKWGLGYLYEHGVFEIPLQYGNDVEFYKNIDKELALDYFIEFARIKGVRFEW